MAQAPTLAAAEAQRSPWRRKVALEHFGRYQVRRADIAGIHGLTQVPIAGIAPFRNTYGRCAAATAWLSTSKTCAACVPYFGERPRQIAGLPDNLALSPGRLEIRFQGTEDLLRSLFELSAAVQSDFPASQRACGD
jgi:hypothetical protein